MHLIERLTGLVAPHDCLVCGGEGSLLCDRCRPGALITKRPTCFGCNALSSAGRTCRVCRHHSPLFAVTVASHYEGPIRELVQRTKYAYAREGAYVAATLLIPLLADQDYDLIVPVPTAVSRARQRGFDHAALLAQALAAQLPLPCLSALRRLGHRRQVGMDRRHRLAQVSGSFEVRDSTTAQLADSRILLVDDVLTTGATMSECARILKAAGAARISGAVLAKH